ncbi:MAG: hypothetical protein H7289_03925 [Mucilaginibacter sp.]|nr:hypothetical protein [Mucilaginibacter sp.]
MKRLFATLVMLTGAIAVNAQQTSFTLFPKQAPIKHMSKNFVCSCHTNYTNQMTSLLKSKANVGWFEKMTKLTVDTDRNKSQHSQDTTYKSSGYTVYNNISVNQLLNTSATVNPDRMPIAKLTNTDTRMPIVQTDKTGYTMPVAGKTQPRVYYQTVSPKNVVDGVEVRP